MIKHEIKIDYVTPESIIPYPGNTKRHPDSEIIKLAEMIKAYGFDQPIVVDKDMVIIKGHGRLLAHKKLGSELIPIVMRDDLSPALVKASRIADNKSNESEWDLDLLAIEFDDLKEIDFDLELTGFDDFQFTADEKEPETIEDISPELPGAMALKIDMSFSSKLPWNIPELRADMLSEIPPKLKTWAGHDATPDDGESFYMWNWRTDSLKGSPKDRLIIGFYTDDYRFNPVWEQPDIFVSKMLNMGVRVALTPNFSLWHGQAEACHLWATYKSRWVGRYMQEAGIAVIPDINWADDSSFNFCLLGIPKNCPSVSVQLQTLKDDAETKRAIHGLQRALNELEPKSLIVYGHKKANEIMEKIKYNGFVRYLGNRTEYRRIVMNSKGK